MDESDKNDDVDDDDDDDDDKTSDSEEDLAWSLIICMNRQSQGTVR